MANTCLKLSATFQTGPEVKHYNQDLGETDEYSLRSDRVYHQLLFSASRPKSWSALHRCLENQTNFSQYTDVPRAT